MYPETILNEVKNKMVKAVDHFKQELASIRSSRAHPSLLENIKVEAYGNKISLREVASISSPEPGLLVVQVWDQSNVSGVEKAIRQSDLGLNPNTENNMIRVPVPPLSEERRKEMTKVVGEKTQEAHISVRNTRREAIDKTEELEKSKQIAEDEKFRLSEKIQRETDEATNKISQASKQKTSELMQI